MGNCTPYHFSRRSVGTKMPLHACSPFTEPFCVLVRAAAVCLVSALPCVALLPLGRAYLQGRGQLFLCQHLIPAEHKGTFLPHHLQLAQEVPLLRDQLLLGFASGACFEDSRAANPARAAVEGKWKSENQCVAPAPEMLQNRLIFHVTLGPCFTTSLFKRHFPPRPILSQSGHGCRSRCSAALRTVTIWMSAVSLVLPGYGSAKPYMCRSCQLAICP